MVAASENGSPLSQRRYPMYQSERNDDVWLLDWLSSKILAKVEYENGTKNDIILLNKINGEETVFEGILLKEKCPVSAFREDPSNLDNIEVLFHHILTNYVFDRLSKLDQKVEQ